MSTTENSQSKTTRKGLHVTALDITVNEQPYTVDVDPTMPLLWVLRDVLKLTGTKFGCGIGICGACTIHLDGIPTRACQTPISTIQGKKITTIEGVSADLSNPVQQAWIAENVPQCGYCQPGQIMTAVALLKQSPRPTNAEITAAMSHVLCRCGTYLRILKAIQDAANTVQGG